MADIYLSSGGRMYRLPFIPAEMPEVSVSARNEEFPTYQSGVYNIMGGAGLREISLEGVLPGRSYDFAKSSVRGKEIINMLDVAMRRKRTVRLVISGRNTINLLASVESLAYHENQTGNIVYSVTFKEYRNV
ncbi:hypothetical protein [Anaerotruncus rubiinfantis]|uniref:hypothetical protein n=1 Tax=Anaerotruncus rubiinfantis TaxID=1720200 RepID=UPI00082BAC68|nr:hypothetical protein [Anaerotruncus rubiinfantis]